MQCYPFRVHERWAYPDYSSTAFLVELWVDPHPECSADRRKAMKRTPVAEQSRGVLHCSTEENTNAKAYEVYAKMFRVGKAPRFLI
jgi:hypothetical protein